MFKICLLIKNQICFDVELLSKFTILDCKAILEMIFLVFHFYTDHLLDTHNKNDDISIHRSLLALVLVLRFVYIGYFRYSFTDQGFIFTSEQWKQLTTLNAFKLPASSMEVHSTLETKKNTITDQLAEIINTFNLLI